MTFFWQDAILTRSHISIIYIWCDVMNSYTKKLWEWKKKRKEARVSFFLAKPFILWPSSSLLCHLIHLYLTFSLSRCLVLTWPWPASFAWWGGRGDQSASATSATCVASCARPHSWTFHHNISHHVQFWTFSLCPMRPHHSLRTWLI